MKFLLVCLSLLVGFNDAQAINFIGQPLPEEGKLKLDFAPFTFSMFERGRVVGKVSVMLTLEVQDGSKVEFVKQRMPQMRADFNIALSQLAKVRFDVNEPVDPDLIKEYLTPFADYRVGDDVVRVYLKQALIEPAR